MAKRKKEWAAPLTLFSESRADTETGVISQDTYSTDICQVEETFYGWESEKRKRKKKQHKYRTFKTF